MADTTLRALKKVKVSTDWIGREILWVRSTSSTNDLAWTEAERGCPDGMVVLAEEQTAGRGRHGRSWVCPPGKGILMSVVLRSGVPADQGPLLTVVGALALRDTASAVCGRPAAIRWPNDVLLDGRKVAGVLVETRSLPHGAAPACVVGLGLNVSLGTDDLPDAIRESSTSLSAAAGAPVDRLEAARRLLESLDAWIGALRSGRREPIARAWRESSAVINRRVEVRFNGELLSGSVEDIDPVEGIFLRLDRGGIRRLRGEHVDLLRVIA